MAVKQITNTIYESAVLHADKPVLLDFYADWCGPCKMLAPVIEEIANERQDILIGKINVDDEPALAEKFGILSIPTLIALRNGKVTDTIIGVRPKADILAILPQKEG